MTDHELELETDKVDPSIRHRNPTLLLAMLGYLEEVAEAVPWNELIELHTTAHRWKTVENAVYDLAKFGAVARTGKAGRRGTADTRKVALTPLGLAWLRGVVLPLPGAELHIEPPEELLEAEEVAAHFEVPVELLGDVHTLEEGSEQ